MSPVPSRLSRGTGREGTGRFFFQRTTGLQPPWSYILHTLYLINLYLEIVLVVNRYPTKGGSRRLEKVILLKGAQYSVTLNLIHFFFFKIYVFILHIQSPLILARIRFYIIILHTIPHTINHWLICKWRVWWWWWHDGKSGGKFVTVVAGAGWWQMMTAGQPEL